MHRPATVTCGELSQVLRDPRQAPSSYGTVAKIVEVKVGYARLRLGTIKGLSQAVCTDGLPVFDENQVVPVDARHLSPLFFQLVQGLGWKFRREFDGDVAADG